MATILIVDDDADFREITRATLERDGHQVEMATNGDEGLEQMRRHPPDLVILDVMMSSVLDGIDLTDRMRTDATLKKTPIIMVSAIATSEYAHMFPTDTYLPVECWLCKPVAPDILLDRVHDMLKQRTG
ncbi:MAG: response regulator transcription factor [Anaerolineae bacterium]